MAASADLRSAAPAAERQVTWRGRSGRCYSLAAARLDDFALTSSELTIIADARGVLWIGSANDVIDDAASRARFRLAVTRADRVFRLAAPADAVARSTLIWDLESAHPALGLTAA